MPEVKKSIYIIFGFFMLLSCDSKSSISGIQKDAIEEFPDSLIAQTRVVNYAHQQIAVPINMVIVNNAEELESVKLNDEIHLNVAINTKQTVVEIIDSLANYNKRTSKSFKEISRVNKVTFDRENTIWEYKKSIWGFPIEQHHFHRLTNIGDTVFVSNFWTIEPNWVRFNELGRLSTSIR